MNPMMQGQAMMPGQPLIPQPMMQQQPQQQPFAGIRGAVKKHPKRSAGVVVGVVIGVIVLAVVIALAVIYGGGSSTPAPAAQSTGGVTTVSSSSGSASPAGSTTPSPSGSATPGAPGASGGGAAGTGTGSATTPPLSAIKYGQKFTLANQWNNQAASQGAIYLYGCNSAPCNGTSTVNASAGITPTALMFVDPKSATNKGVVQYGDNVYVQLVASSAHPALYLTACGPTEMAVCGTNLVFANSADSEKSLFTVAAYTGGSTTPSTPYVNNIDVITLTSNSIGTQVSMCGAYASGYKQADGSWSLGPVGSGWIKDGPGCGWNASLRTDDESSAGAGLKGWQISKT
jgi:hypothetical protein